MSIFREEAVKNRSNRAFGEVSILLPVSYNYAFAILLLMVVSALLFVSSSNYQKKESVNGYVFPSKGVIKLYSPGSTYVHSITVNEGDIVTEGQVIGELRYSNGSLIGRDLNDEIAKEIESQVMIIERRKDVLKSLYDKEYEENRIKISSLIEHLGFIDKQINSAVERMDLFKMQLDRYSRMNKSGYLSGEQKETKQNTYLLAEQNVHELQERKSKIQREINILYSIEERLPIELANELEKLNLEQSLKSNRLLEIKGQEGVILKAKTSGMITSLNMKQGQELKSQEYLASILPIDSKMEVELLVPTRAFGFVVTGQHVRVKLGAFPYQKYGTLSGTVIEITQSIILPTELNLPVRISEPFYRVTVALDKQNVQAHGEEFHLQAGMLVEADIITDTRTLLEWIFEPLISLVG